MLHLSRKKTLTAERHTQSCFPVKTKLIAGKINFITFAGFPFVTSAEANFVLLILPCTRVLCCELGRDEELSSQRAQQQPPVRGLTCLLRPG